MMGAVTQTITRKIDAMSRRKHTIRREAGLHLKGKPDVSSRAAFSAQ